MVVALLVIMTAVAVPALAGFLESREMVRLDHGAKQIFLSAQNRLLGVRSAGTLKLVSNAVPNSAPLPDGTNYGVVASFDTPSAATGTRAVDQVLPVGSADASLLNNHYIVVFDQSTGLLQETFYSEKPLSAADLAKLDPWRGDEAVRRRERIGYYNSSTDSPNIVTLDPVQLLLENGERLLMVVILPDNATDPSVLQLECSIEDANITTQRQDLVLSFTTGSGGFDETTVSGGKTAYVKVLDSLNAGKAFSAVCPNITPGADIRVSARLTPTSSARPGADILLPSTTVSATGNSLFESVHAETRSGLSGQNLCFGVSAGRHLQNIGNLAYGIYNPGTIDATKQYLSNIIPGVNDYFAAEQTGDVDMGAGSEWSAQYPGKTFVPLYSKMLGFYNGNSFTIRGLVIDSDFSSGVALFGTISSVALHDAQRAQLTNVVLESPNVRARGYYIETCAALVGTTRGLDIRNCQITGNGQVASTANQTRNLGGLIGYGDQVLIDNCQIQLDKLSGGGHAQSLGQWAANEGNWSIQTQYSTITINQIIP